MNINDLNLDELQTIDNNFLANWIKKDLTTGKHFCYLKIDKRNLTETWMNDEIEMLKTYCHCVSVYASRYAYLTFDEDFAKKLELRLVDVRKIKELYEEAEDTTWLIYEFIFIYVAKNENNNEYCAFNASFINCIECDYAPKVLVEKVKDRIPELADLEPGNIKQVSVDYI